MNFTVLVFSGVVPLYVVEVGGNAGQFPLIVVGVAGGHNRRYTGQELTATRTSVC